MKRDGRYLLDTNIIIALFGHDANVKSRCQHGDVEIYVPVIVVGELLYGLNRSKQYSSNIRRIQDFLKAVTILNCDETTARNYGEIKHDLKNQGAPIPDNDIWIAGIAKQHDLIMVSRDAHFKKVTGLAVEIW